MYRLAQFKFHTPLLQLFIFKFKKTRNQVAFLSWQRCLKQKKKKYHHLAKLKREEHNLHLGQTTSLLQGRMLCLLNKQKGSQHQRCTKLFNWQAVIKNKMHLTVCSARVRFCTSLCFRSCSRKEQQEILSVPQTLKIYAKEQRNY